MSPVRAAITFLAVVFVLALLIPALQMEMGL